MVSLNRMVHAILPEIVTPLSHHVNVKVFLPESVDNFQSCPGLQKGLSQDLPSSYRPICLVLEALMVQQFMSLETRGLL